MNVFEIPIGGFTYLVDNPVFDNGQKVTLTAKDADGKLLHSDRVNLDYLTKRAKFIGALRGKLALSPGDEGPTEADLFTVRETIIDQIASAQPVDDDPNILPEPSPEALDAALELLQRPDLLERRAAVVTAMGYAGDTTRVRLLDLALMSRLRARPLNLVVTGPSSAGKSFLVNLVVQLHPPYAVYQLSGMSERLLVYTEDDFRHRVVIINEASALHNEGIGASLLRALAWEGKVAYATVESTPDGLKARRIDKPGPTGFITTTTGTIEAELNNRVLTMHIPDTRETTRVILRATAARANGHAPDAPDLEPLHALSWWLETHGSRDVTIPYASQLAEVVPDNQVRMRRDFTQILTLIQTHAMLYQRQRERTEDGRIIADRRDYEAVYELVSDVFGAIAADGVTPALRETVGALQELTPTPHDTTSYRALSEALGIDEAACRQRCVRALKAGWIVNREVRKGYPAHIRVGDALPGASSALPAPEKLFATYDAHNLTPCQLPAETRQEPCESDHPHNPLTASPPENGLVRCEHPVSMADLTAFEADTSRNNGTCEAVSTDAEDVMFSTGPDGKPRWTWNGRQYPFNPLDPFNERSEVVS